MDLKKNFWEETYQRNIKKMISICFRYVSNQQIAEDLAHDAFITAMHKEKTFKAKGKFDAWLRKITVNTTLMHLREIKYKNECRQEIVSDYLVDNYEEKGMWKEFTAPELLKVINTLPEHHRLVFNLYVLDNYSHKQIADELNISEGTSKSHLARARKKLQPLLNKKLQEKKTQWSFLFLLFPIKFGRIDRLFKHKFSNYEIDPQSALPFNNFNWSNIKQPLFKSFFSYSIVTASIASIAVLTAIVVLNKNEQTIIKDQNKAVVAIDTIASLEETDTVSASNITVLETKVTPKPTPVIVKKKRIIRKTIIIQDTLKF